jgi:hypothetical protein
MRRLLLALALTLAIGAAHADNGSFYIGAGISKDKVSGIVNGATNFSDIDTTAWKLLAGLRPLSVFAIEADYLNLGSQTSTFVTTSNRSDANAFAGYAVGFLPIPLPFLDVFGKAGLARWRLNGSSISSLAPGSFSRNGTEFAWGVGTQVHAGNFGARLEYENFRIPGTNGANVVSLDVYVNIF